MSNVQDQASVLRARMNAKTAGSVSEQQVEKVRQARFLCVTSGKGGVGKTNFSVNFAIALAAQGLRVLVVDADFGFANIDVLLGVSVRGNLGHVIRGEKTLEEITEEGHGGILFISGGSGLKELIGMDALQLGGIIEQLQKMEQMADYVLFDTGAGTDARMERILGICDEVFLVITPEPPAMVDAFVIAKAIDVMEQRPKIQLVVNRAENLSEGMQTYRSFKAVVIKHLQVDIELMGCLLMDDAVSKAVKMQVPFLLSFPQAPISKAISQLAVRYAHVAIRSEPKKPQGFFTRLKKLFSASGRE